MLHCYFMKNEYVNRILMTQFRFNHYGLTTNKFSTNIVRTLSKRNSFSIRRCAKFVGHVRCPTIILHPGRTAFLVQTEEGTSKVNGFSFPANQNHVDESILKIQLQQQKMFHIVHLYCYNENKLNQHKNNLRLWN